MPRLRFETGHVRAIPGGPFNGPTPTSNFGDTCDLNGVLPYCRNGSKSADADCYMPVMANFAVGVGMAVAFAPILPTLRHLA